MWNTTASSRISGECLGRDPIGRQGIAMLATYTVVKVFQFGLNRRRVLSYRGCFFFHTLVRGYHTSSLPLA